MDIKTFKSLVDSNDHSIVVLSASWCGPCKVLAKTLDKIKSESDLGQNIFKVDIEDEPDLAVEFGVKSVPTVLFVGQGKTEIKTGVQNENVLLKWLESGV